MKKILVLLMVIAPLFLLASCEEVDDEKPELYILSDFGREVVEKELYRTEIFDAFEEEHDVTIKFETLAQAEDTFNKIDTEQKAENYTVDLLISHFGTMADYIGEGYMQEVDDLEDAMDDRTFLSTFDGSTKSDGNRYFFPINSDVYLSYARTEAFETLPDGLTEEDILDGNYTWEDFIDWAAEIGEGSVHVKGETESMLLYEIGGMALSNGGAFPVMNDEGNIKAWQDIIAMKDYIAEESLTTNVSNELMTSETSGVKLAFELMAPLATAVSQSPAAFEIFPGPTGTSGKAGSIIGGHGIGIVNGAPNQELAEEFIDWFTAPEQIVHAALGTIPTIEEATEELGNDPEDEVIRQGLATVANANVEGLQMISSYTSWAEVKGVYDDVFTGIMDDSITEENLEDFLDDQQDALEALEAS
ncbi:MAG: ABC transporter substrate-binding protein [Acholeplasmataceae bacterium]